MLTAVVCCDGNVLTAVVCCETGNVLTALSFAVRLGTL